MNNDDKPGNLNQSYSALTGSVGPSSYTLTTSLPESIVKAITAQAQLEIDTLYPNDNLHLQSMAFSVDNNNRRLVEALAVSFPTVEFPTPTPLSTLISSGVPVRAILSGSAPLTVLIKGKLLSAHISSLLSTRDHPGANIEIGYESQFKDYFVYGDDNFVPRKTLIDQGYYFPELTEDKKVISYHNNHETISTDASYYYWNNKPVTISYTLGSKSLFLQFANGLTLSATTNDINHCPELLHNANLLLARHMENTYGFKYLAEPSVSSVGKDDKSVFDFLANFEVCKSKIINQFSDMLRDIIKIKRKLYQGDSSEEHVIDIDAEVQFSNFSANVNFKTQNLILEFKLDDKESLHKTDKVDVHLLSLYDRERASRSRYYNTSTYWFSQDGVNAGVKETSFLIYELYAMKNLTATYADRIKKVAEELPLE